MLRIRLQRRGRTKRPIHHIVVADNRKPRDGRIIEDIGRFDNITPKNQLDLDRERALHWLKQGAQPSDTVRSIFKKQGIMYEMHLHRLDKSEEEIEEALAEWRERREEKEEDVPTRKERQQALLEAEQKEYEKQLQKKAEEAAKEKAKQEALASEEDEESDEEEAKAEAEEEDEAETTEADEETQEAETDEQEAEKETAEAQEEEAAEEDEEEEQVERGERLVAARARGHVRKRLARRGERRPNRVLPLGELLARVLPVFERHPRIDGGKQVGERLVRAERPRVELVVQAIELVVAFHGVGSAARGKTPALRPV